MTSYIKVLILSATQLQTLVVNFTKKSYYIILLKKPLPSYIHEEHLLLRSLLLLLYLFSLLILHGLSILEVSGVSILQQIKNSTYNYLFIVVWFDVIAIHIVVI